MVALRNSPAASELGWSLTPVQLQSSLQHAATAMLAVQLQLPCCSQVVGRSARREAHWGSLAGSVPSASWATCGQVARGEPYWGAAGAGCAREPLRGRLPGRQGLTGSSGCEDSQVCGVYEEALPALRL